VHLVSPERLEHSELTAFNKIRNVKKAEFGDGQGFSHVESPNGVTRPRKEDDLYSVIMEKNSALNPSIT